MSILDDIKHYRNPYSIEYLYRYTSFYFLKDLSIPSLCLSYNRHNKETFLVSIKSYKQNINDLFLFACGSDRRKAIAKNFALNNERCVYVDTSLENLMLSKDFVIENRQVNTLDFVLCLLLAKIEGRVYGKDFDSMVQKLEQLTYHNIDVIDYLKES